MDMELKKKLLEMLMADMDKAEVSKIKPKAEPVAIIEKTESEVIPADELKDKIKESIGGVLEAKPEEEAPEADEEEDEEVEELDDLGGSSRMMEKLKEMKRLKAKE